MECKKKIEDILKILSNWEVTKDNREAVKKKFKFNNFKTTFSFMTMVAMKAEQINHHPEWSNVYNQVTIILTTHDLNGLSNKDLELGQFIDDCYKKFSEKI